MKYIRTKEGIYEFPKGFTEFNWNNKTLLENEEHIVWTGGEVIAQADTIEELCDGFIGVPDKEWFEKNSVATKGINYFQKPFDLEYGIYKEDFANLKLENQNGWTYSAIEWQRDKHDFIFGYIETNRGLIYVAEMNDKGKLELS